MFDVANDGRAAEIVSPELNPVLDPRVVRIASPQRDTIIDDVGRFVFQYSMGPQP
jgi:hypothetical protein